uniref:Uncharacterized protein n=1 Tax=Glossina austeni TaxID=7395 RepID=A0A1A9USC3_GLOAU
MQRVVVASGNSKGVCNLISTSYSIQPTKRTILYTNLYTTLYYGFIPMQETKSCVEFTYKWEVDSPAKLFSVVDYDDVAHVPQRLQLHAEDIMQVVLVATEDDGITSLRAESTT